MRWAAPVAAVAFACAEPAVEAPAPAEPAVVRASVDKAVATTGDVITYTIEVDHEPGIEVQLPEVGAQIAGFRIVDVGGETAELRDRVVDSRWYKLRADLVGSYVLPEAVVQVRAGPEAEWSRLEASRIFVEVQSVLPADGEATDIRGLKPLRPPPPRAVPWALIAGAGGVVLLALLALGFLLRRRSRPEPPPRPAHELAFDALDALRGVDLDDPEAVRAWTFALSMVLRSYVEARFGLNATDLTSEEILQRCVSLPELAPEQRALLTAFVEATDRVKYAAHDPGPEAAEASFEHALQFVEATVPQPAPAEGA